VNKSWNPKGPRDPYFETIDIAKAMSDMQDAEPKIREMRSILSEEHQPASNTIMPGTQPAPTVYPERDTEPSQAVTVAPLTMASAENGRSFSDGGIATAAGVSSTASFNRRD